MELGGDTAKVGPHSPTGATCQTHPQKRNRGTVAVSTSYPNDIEVLKNLEEDGGFTVTKISVRCAPDSWNRRSTSGYLTALLRKMEDQGLVRRLDDLKPVAWCRTEKGTEALH